MKPQTFQAAKIRLFVLSICLQVVLTMMPAYSAHTYTYDWLKSDRVYERDHSFKANRFQKLLKGRATKKKISCSNCNGSGNCLSCKGKGQIYTVICRRLYPNPVFPSITMFFCTPNASADQRRGYLVLPVVVKAHIPPMVVSPFGPISSIRQ